MEKETGKVGRLVVARAGLVAIYFAVTAGGLLLSWGGPFTQVLALLAVCSAFLLLYSLASGDDGYFLWAWVTQGVIWAGLYPVLDPNANLLTVVAFASASLGLIDAAHTLGLVYPMSLWGSPMAASESSQVWSLLSSHFVKDAVIGTATFLISIGSLVLVFPVSLVTGLLFRTSVFAAVALVLVSLVVAGRQNG